MGEIRRMFFRHKVYKTLHAVEIDPKGIVLAALDVAIATACSHRLDTYELELDAAAAFNEHKNDYEVVEPGCTDPTHVLADIGAAEKECSLAEAEFNEADRHAKALKKIFESKQARMREIVRDGTNPRPLPLFAQSA